MRSVHPVLAAAVTWRGYVLLVITALVAGSAESWMRLRFGGLSVHPYLLPVMGLFAYQVVNGEISVLPKAVLIGFFLFIAFYWGSVFNGPKSLDSGVSEIIKITSSVVVIVVVASLSGRRGDFLMGAYGLIFAGVFVSLKGLLGNTALSNAMGDIANENAMSLYTLPAFLLAGFLLRDFRNPNVIRIALIAAILIIGVSTFLSSNRSGWLGIAFVGGMLLVTARRKGTALMLAAAAVAAGIFMFQQFDTTVFSESLAESEGTRGEVGNQLRWQLFVNALEIGIAHPVLGVSPIGLPYELGESMGLPYAINSHNVIGHLFGSLGLAGFMSCVLVGWALWHRPEQYRGKASEFRIHDILRILLILWLVRGFFTHEILYSPSFCSAIALLFGFSVSTRFRSRTGAGQGRL